MELSEIATEVYLRGLPPARAGSGVLLPPRPRARLRLRLLRDGRGDRVATRPLRRDRARRAAPLLPPPGGGRELRPAGDGLRRATAPHAARLPEGLAIEPAARRAG